jgi:peptidoglycan hydrolase-like protein with peptidoglycan-binding domain
LIPIRKIKVNNMDTLKNGNRGSQVELLQQELIEAGYKPGAIDGVFGKGTLTAVKAFQKANKLVADGIVGSKTWDKLLSDNKVVGILKAVYYSQKDKRWGTKMYSSHNDKSQTIANSGCGIASSAMVVATMADKTVTPVDMAILALANGERTYNSGTDYGHFFDVAKKYRLRCRQTQSTDEVVQALKEYKLVVCNIGPDFWTKKGHYILLIGTDNKYIYAHDPASVLRTKNTIKSFQKQAKAYFIFSK